MTTTTPGPPNEPVWLTVQEVAAELRVSKMTIYRLIDNGELPAIRFGRTLRIDRTEFDNYLRTAHTNRSQP